MNSNRRYSLRWGWASSVRTFLRTSTWLGCCAILISVANPALAQDQPTGHPALPTLRLSLHDAMKAAIDENPNVQLFKERITQAQDQAFTQLGALLPNLSATASGARRRFFLGSFAGDDAVEQAPGVAQEIKGLLRAPHHAEGPLVFHFRMEHPAPSARTMSNAT